MEVENKKQCAWKTPAGAHRHTLHLPEDPHQPYCDVMHLTSSRADLLILVHHYHSLQARDAIRGLTQIQMKQLLTSVDNSNNMNGLC